MSLELPLVRRVLDIARSAPSAHNTQPWRVVREGSLLRVESDEARRLSHTDPARRDHDLSLGAFTECLRIAAAGLGLSPNEVEPRGAFSAVELGRGEARDADLVSLVRRRQTSRLAYAPRFPEASTIVALERAARANGLRLHLLAQDTVERARVDELFFAAAREGWLDGRAVAETRRWIRFDPEGLRSPDDGLSTHCLAMSPTQAALFLALLRGELWTALGKVFAAPSLAEALAREESKPVAQTPFLAVLIADSRANGHGRALLRTWLEATKLGLWFHPISALLDRRGWELGKLLGVNADNLVFAARLGRSAPPPRSGRREVEAFASV